MTVKMHVLYIPRCISFLFISTPSRILFEVFSHAVITTGSYLGVNEIANVLKQQQEGSNRAPRKPYSCSGQIRATYSITIWSPKLMPLNMLQQ